MTEQELRALVREAIARVAADAARGPMVPSPGAAAGAARLHLSHAQFSLVTSDPEGRCLIEPGVPCNHCGYCKSYGH